MFGAHLASGGGTGVGNFDFQVVYTCIGFGTMGRLYMVNNTVANLKLESFCYRIVRRLV